MNKSKDINQDFNLSKEALERVKVLLKDEKGSYFRISVLGGGCSGFQYGFAYAKELEQDDTNVEQHGASVVVDNMSYQYMWGAEIDYKDDLQGATFVIRNPQATATCGCGSSFAYG